MKKRECLPPYSVCFLASCSCSVSQLAGPGVVRNYLARSSLTPAGSFLTSLDGVPVSLPEKSLAGPRGQLPEGSTCALADLPVWSLAF